MILKTLTIEGSASRQALGLPEPTHPTQRVAYVFSQNTEEVLLLQEDSDDSPQLRIPADDGIGTTISSFRLSSAPAYVLVDSADSVEVSVVAVQ